MENKGSALAQKFGKYKLLHRLAVGGMAEIFVARHLGMKGFSRKIVIKRIRAHLSNQDAFVNMFLNEAKLAAQLSHSNICQIYDLGRIEDTFFIAMEYVRGRDMRRVIKKAEQAEIPFPGHNREGEIEDLVTRYLHRRKPGVCVNVGLGVEGAQKLVAETDGAFRSRVDQVRALDLVGVRGRFLRFIPFGHGPDAEAQGHRNRYAHV